MDFFTTLKKIWFPSKETRANLTKLKKDYEAKLAPQNILMSEYKIAKSATGKALNDLELTFRKNSDRLNELEGCFDQKSALYETLNSQIAESKSTQSDLNSAYQKLKKSSSSKSDYYDWAGRQRSLWNGYSGRGGKKIRSEFNPMGLFNKYTRGDLERYKGGIASAKASIDQLKSKRSSISSKIEITKSAIGDAKKLCAYVKTTDGKNEVKELRKKITSLQNQRTQLRSSLESHKAKVSNQSLAIKSIKKDWNDEKRKMKLSQ